MADICILTFLLGGRGWGSRDKKYQKKEKTPGVGEVSVNGCACTFSVTVRASIVMDACCHRLFSVLGLLYFGLFVSMYFII